MSKSPAPAPTTAQIQTATPTPRREINPRLLKAIQESHALRKKRKRSAVLNITLTDEERDEFRQICAEHGMLERELLVNSMRAFKTLTRRVTLLEARLALIEQATKT